MRERPVLFNTLMVLAILDGQKTVTRRVMKPQPPEWCSEFGYTCATPGGAISGRGRFGNDGPAEKFFPCRYGQQGDRLWVRETWARVPRTAYRCSTGVQQREDPTCGDMVAVYRANWTRCAPSRWRPSIHMPRWASRITLEITSVKVERLQSIDEQGARAEGCLAIPGYKWHTFEEADAGVPMHDHTARDAFEALWETINGEGSWAANPWVWVIEFARVETARG